MIEYGEVKKVTDGFALVLLPENSECGKCGKCGFNREKAAMEITARNALGAKEGDRVAINTGNVGKLTSILLVFCVPLLLLVGGAFAGTALKGEIWIAVFGLAPVLLWYTVIAVIDKKLARNNKFCAEITEIQGDNNERKHTQDNIR